MAAQTVVQEWHLVKDGSRLSVSQRLTRSYLTRREPLTSAAPAPGLRRTIDSASLSLAAALALHSRHPYSQALVEAAAGLTPSPVVFDDITEQAGFGLQAQSGATVYRLGTVGALASPESIVGAASVALTQNGQ